MSETKGIHPSFFLLFILAACSSSEPDFIDTGDGGKIVCGDPTAHDVTLSFGVADSEGNGVSNLAVSLVDRSWEPGVLGEGQTDGQGLGSLLAVGVTDLPDCWGTLLNYVVEVSKRGIEEIIEDLEDEVGVDHESWSDHQTFVA